MVWLRTTRLFDSRKTIFREDLQSAITEVVRTSDPALQDFVGVIITGRTPKSRYDADWVLKGVRFGGADREKADRTLSAAVERMQREFSLSMEPLKNASDGKDK